MLSTVMGIDATILICSSHPLAAEGLAGVLKAAGYDVLPVCGSDEQCFEAVRASRPTLVFLEGSMVKANSIRTLADKDLTVAVLVGPETKRLLRDAYMAGAKGSISSDVSSQQILQSVELLLQGATVLSLNPGELMLEAARDAADGRIAEALSGREQQLAILVAQGESNKEIAEAMSISEHTVKVHVGNILTKLDLRNRQQLAVYVAKEGMLEDIAIP